MTPFKPIFSGQLVRLAAPVPEDQSTFARWTQDDNYLRLLDDDPVKPRNNATFASFTEADDDRYYFHLRTLDDDTLIGFVALFNIKWSNQAAEIAIGIGDPDYRGKGYGTDALRVILSYGFNELNLHRIGLHVISYNTDAIKAYERIGFMLEGTLRQAIQRQGDRYDVLVYGILREDFMNSSVN